MFCEQCEQTASGQGCHQWGACGKSPETNAVQDLSMYCLRGLAPVALKAKELGLSTQMIDRFTTEAIFATMTNVNFDQKRFIGDIKQAIAYREQLKALIQTTTGLSQEWPEICRYEPDYTESLSAQGQDITLKFISQSGGNVDVFSLKLTVLYGIKGVASYAFHAQEMGQEDERIYQFIYEALANLDRQDLSLNDWVEIALKVGEINLRTMELLDAGHTGTYGHPIPTSVPLNARIGKALLVSGHDIPQLEEILKQTANQGITVYTHGELLPAHGYPQLKQTYPHLYGHYGTAWQNQTRDFAKFPGAVVVTTNCLMPPHDNYSEKLFSVGPVGYPGLQAIPVDANGHADYTPAIHKALELSGFTTDEPPRHVMTGFARNAVLGVADQVISAVKAGKIRHFFLIGGCDGAKPDRNYYTELVEKVPEDCVVLTLACGKFRFFDKDLGAIDGIPRLLDIGQCNDAYSAIQIAIALAQAFETDVNHLPLSMILSWYEQKAVAVLLTLLHLGIQDIRLGPTLPAFISPNVFKLLSDTYRLKPISTPEADLAACLS
ncbi:MAG TPA: hydroxylamine reductase [Stenomitos sp.]